VCVCVGCVCVCVCGCVCILVINVSTEQEVVGNKDRPKSIAYSRAQRHNFNILVFF